MMMPSSEADGNADEADGQRDPRAVDDAAQHVAPQPVGAEEEQRPALGRADEVQIPGHPAPVFISLAAAEEAHRLNQLVVLGVFALPVLRVEAEAVAIDEGADEAALVVEEMELLRRGEDGVHVARMQRIGRQELADEDRRIEDQEEAARKHRQAMPAEAPPHHLPLRGEIEPFLLRRQPLDRQGIEGRGRHHMRMGSPCPSGSAPFGPPLFASAKGGSVSGWGRPSFGRSTATADGRIDHRPPMHRASNIPARHGGGRRHAG